MKLLRKIRVKTKLTLAFLVVAILIGAVGAVGYVSLKNTDKSAEEMYSNNLQSVSVLKDMEQNLTEIRCDMLQLLYVKDPTQKTQIEANIKKNKDANDKSFKDYDKLASTSAEKQEWAAFKSQLDQYRSLRDNVIKLVDEGNYDEAVKEYQKVPEVRNKMYASLDKLIGQNVEDAKQANDSIHSTYIASNLIMIVLSIAGFVIALLLGTLISKDINTPLMKAVDFANNLAKFDLTKNIPVVRKDEFGQMGAALTEAQENIRELVKAVMMNSEELSASSQELSATVEELTSKAMTIDEAIGNIAGSLEENSVASEEISASVEEVDSSMNELAEKAMEGSNNAGQFKERALEVQENSRDAIDQTRKMYAEKQDKMMKAIEDGKVVEDIRIMADTIASIADQTNLLALNAAIEAARAGEQGRGFAVVAEEVKKLAEQSSEAVTGIKDTISKVQAAFKSSIDTGSDMLEFINKDVQARLDAYGKTGNQYYNDSDFVSNMSEEIAAMSEEITATVGQVSQAVQNVAETVQKSNEHAEAIRENMDENTKAVEQVALTAQSQAELAQKLNEMVQQFKL